jgi:phage repressor protein C with HTH and peptisase S24 domain
MTADERREILKKVMQEKGLNPNSWAVKAGVSEGSLRNFLKGLTESLNIRTYQKLAEAAGCSLDFLIGNLSVGEAAELLPALRDDVSVVARRSHEIASIDGVEYVRIGQYDTSLSAGPGSLNEPNPEPIGWYLIERQWLDALTSANPAHLFVARVDDDSMAPTLQPGDWVLGDRTQQDLGREGIYALLVRGKTWVKRLSPDLGGGSIQVISDNGRYPVQVMPEDEVIVLGRILSVVMRRI